MRPQDPKLVVSQYATEAPLGGRWAESLGGSPRPKLVDAPVRAHIACAILVAQA